MFCQNCGNPLPNEANFCMKCGKSVTNAVDVFADQNVFGSEYGTAPQSGNPFGVAYQNNKSDQNVFFQGSTVVRTPQAVTLLRLSTLICGIVLVLLAFAWFGIAVFLKSYGLVDGQLNQTLQVPKAEFDAFLNLQMAGTVILLVNVVLVFWIFRFAKAANLSKTTNVKNYTIIIVVLSLVLALLIASMIVMIFSCYATNDLYNALLNIGYTQESIEANSLVPIFYRQGVDIAVNALYQFVWMIIFLSITLIYTIKEYIKTKRKNGDTQK